LSIAIIDHIFDSTDIDACRAHNPFDGVDNIGGRSETLDLEAGLCAFNHTGVGQALAARSLADIRRAKIKGLASEMHIDA